MNQAKRANKRELAGEGTILIFQLGVFDLSVFELSNAAGCGVQGAPRRRGG